MPGLDTSIRSLFRDFVVPGVYWHRNYPTGIEILRSPSPYIMSYRVVGESRRQCWI